MLNGLRETGQADSLEAKVLETFFGHPTMVGSPSMGSRPLDTARTDDQRLLLRSIEEKLEGLLKTLGFLEQKRARTLHGEYLAIP